MRTAANVFGISKSTVHKDMTERLSELSPDKAERVKKVLLRQSSRAPYKGRECDKREV